MIVGAGNNISKAASLVKCSKVAVTNVYKEWIPKQKTRSQCKVCDCHELLKVRSERRIEKVDRSNRRATIREVDRLNAQRYLSVTSDQVHLLKITKYSDKDGYFQQDNAFCYTAGIVPRCFKQKDGNLTLLIWPTESPDFNRFENLWYEIK
ncbi:hypothetical protein TNCV_1224661 [Trichonephila clavipes]|nr:hypothetical protein TNCV_1224661 [Trichonephila clavipes]